MVSTFSIESTRYYLKNNRKSSFGTRCFDLIEILSSGCSCEKGHLFKFLDNYTEPDADHIRDVRFDEHNIKWKINFYFHSKVLGCFGKQLVGRMRCQYLAEI